LNIAAIDVVEVAATSDLDSDAESQDGETDYYTSNNNNNSAANNYSSSSSSQRQRTQSGTGNGGSNGYVHNFMYLQF
jgi:hypothetical protein